MKWTMAGSVCLLATLASYGLVGQGKRTNEDINTRSVRGIVTDASGNRVEKAVVLLKDTKSLQIRSFITESDGAYHFAGLSINVDYQLKAAHEDYSSSSKRLSVFDSKRIATINLKLKKKTN